MTVVHESYFTGTSTTILYPVQVVENHSLVVRSPCCELMSRVFLLHCVTHGESILLLVQLRTHRFPRVCPPDTFVQRTTLFALPRGHVTDVGTWLSHLVSKREQQDIVALPADTCSRHKVSFLRTTASLLKSCLPRWKRAHFRLSLMGQP